MRDNPSHYTEILAGMWGARLDSTAYRKVLNSGMMRIVEDLKARGARGQGWFKGLDQALLTKDIWPLIREGFIKSTELIDELVLSPYWTSE